MTKNTHRSNIEKKKWKTSGKFSRAFSNGISRTQINQEKGNQIISLVDRQQSSSIVLFATNGRNSQQEDTLDKRSL